MASSVFRCEGESWFCNSSLPSDIVVVVNQVKFHLHKFPLISRCGKIATMFEGFESREETVLNINLEDFPGDADTFLNVVKFCYGARVEFTPRNFVSLYCAADFLAMTDTYGEDNLLFMLENFFHDSVLKHWKDCVLVLQCCEGVLSSPNELRLSSRCIEAMSVMICTDPSLFGWPLKMYGSLQSPGGSILWNGINTGAKIHCDDSNWWFEDVSFLCVELFEKLINSVKAKGVSAKIIAGAIMLYCTKNLPGLCRWQGQQSAKSRTATSLNVKPATVDQKFILETIIKLLPDKRGKSFCRFSLGLLRVSLIVGVDRLYLVSLEKKVGIQLEFATLDSLLIPSYSDSDTLYECDCVERMILHFVSSCVDANCIDNKMSPSSRRCKRVSKLIDQYLAEVACDANLMPGKFRRLNETLPDCSRVLHDGVYRAVDIYLKEHSWMTDMEKEELCRVIDFQKVSIDGCAHASQNERLPMRFKFQALFFEQMHLRIAVAGYLNPEIAHTDNELKINMDRMMSRVGELEQEITKINVQVKKMKDGFGHVPVTGIGCNLLPRYSNQTGHH